MNLQQKVERSRSNERIDFSKYQSSGQDDALIKIESSERILVEPCWTIEDDWEGERYRDYIAEHPEYDAVYVRSELATRLQKAAQALPESYRLVVRAGHRPIEVQKRILIDCADDYKEEHPGTSDEKALEHARTFVNDPDLTLPPHVCGAAVDVDVLDTKTGKLLDFGSKLNDDTEKSFLYHPDLTQEQKDNRLMLVTAMLEVGLASCKPEWWHFSYGDQVWAWFYGHEQSLYSPVDI
ncbi:hypothetical protein E6P97_01120 [Patescibacteria group bacterium]|jgi:D-alanyl-D-alanine dipeptidase|nr:MAG: hypothetical protein E6P97_01120 [Patescibacteria group bacterium]